MARVPFDQQQYTLTGASSLRTPEENTGTRDQWKPVNGQRTNEVGGWGGKGYVFQQDPATGGMYAVPGSRMSDEDVERYRRMGAAHQDAVQLDQTQANASKGLELGSLAGLAVAARGGAPSRAAELGALANDNAAMAAARASVGRGGKAPVNAIAATRGAMTGLQTQDGQIAGQVGDMRAQEMGRARTDFAGGAAGVRRQDIGAAVTNAQLEAANRDLEARRRQQFEKLAWDTRNAELYGGVEQKNQEEQAALNERRAKAAEDEQDRQKMMDFVGMGAGMFTGALSDRRTKHVVTYGSLAGMHGRRK